MNLEKVGAILDDIVVVVCDLVAEIQAGEMAMACR